MSKDWTERLSERAERYEMPVPESLWGGIEDSMRGIQQERKDKRTKTLWLVGGCSAAASILVAALFMFDSKQDKGSLTADNASDITIEGTKVEKPITTDVKNSDKEDQTILLAQNVAKRQPLSTGVGQSNASVERIAETSEKGTDNSTDEGQNSIESTSQKTDGTGDTEKKVGGQTNRTLLGNGEKRYEAYHKPKRRTSWSSGVYASGFYSNGGDNADVRVGSSIMEDMIANDIDLHHSEPINVGLSVRLNLANHWGVESGLTYSYLKSDYDGHNYSARQELHYVGIPLKVSYSIVETKHLNVYVAAGGKAEKLVKGKCKVDYNMDINSTVREEIKESRLQFSASLSAGIQYNITNNVGLYLEPGVTRYFDNGSSVTNIYKDEPTKFNVSLGLRFTP